MKKLLSLLLVAVLAITCSAVSFSATETSATPDEAKILKSFELTEFPDRTKYSLDQIEAGWDISNLNTEIDPTDREQLLAELEKAEFFINVDLSGAVFTAYYTDGSSEVIDNSLCTTSVTHPISLRAVFEEIEDMESEDDTFMLEAMLMHEYEICVEYMGGTARFYVELIPGDLNNDDIYEFVSYTNPDKNSYTVTYEQITDEYGYYYLDFDITGMTATVRNKETGELTTYGDDSIYVEFSYEANNINDVLPRDEYIAKGYVFTDDGEIVPFVYEFRFNGEKAETPSDDEPTQNTTPVEPDTDDAQSTTKPESTTDTATKDTATKDTVNKTDNNAIQTGNPVTAILLVVVMLSATAVAYVFYRKKAE